MNGFDPTSGAHIETAPREILSSNISKVNMMPWPRFYEVAITTLSTLEGCIRPLCGAKALHNMIIHHQMTGEFNTNVFSNDGIHILSTIEFMSPIQTYICNYVKYVADRVESSAADGTSTAILLSIWYIRTALVIANTIRRSSDSTNEKRNRLHEEFLEFSDSLVEMRTEIAKLRVPLLGNDSIDVGSIIYQLAYTSSKGNDILSKYAVTIYQHLPEELYQLSMYRKEAVETETQFRIEHVQHDASINVLPSARTEYNSSLYTEVDRKGVTMIVLPENIGSMTHVIEYIESLKDTTTHVVLLSYSLSASEENQFNTVLSPSFFTLCMHTNFRTVLVNNPLELMGVLAIAGNTYRLPVDIDMMPGVTINDVDIQIVGGNTLRLSNLVESSSDHIHPLYRSKESEFYNRLVSDITNKIRMLKESHQQTVGTKSEVAAFLELFRDLVCHSLPTLVIGGSTHDVLSNINVVNDVLGVVSVCMKEGVLIDALPKITCLSEGLHAYDELSPYLEDYTTDMYNGKLPEGGHEGTTAMSCITQSDSGEYEWEELNTESTDCVIQSFRALDETYKRLLEVVPKLIMTEAVMVPNSVA